MIIKRVFISALLMVAFTSVHAQLDTAFAKAGIRRCGDSLVYSFRHKDWDLFAKYTNPAMIGSMGGLADFKTFMSQLFYNIPDSAWKEYRIGNILQVVKTPGELQTIIELKTVIQWQGTRIRSTSHLIGQSWDGGYYWTFFDSQGDPTSARLIKPDLSKEIIIPQRVEKTEPIGH